MSKEIKAQIRLLRFMFLPAEKRGRIVARYNQMLGKHIIGAADKDETNPEQYDTFRREQIAKRAWNLQNSEGDYK